MNPLLAVKPRKKQPQSQPPRSRSRPLLRSVYSRSRPRDALIMVLPSFFPFAMSGPCFQGMCMRDQRQGDALIVVPPSFFILLASRFCFAYMFTSSETSQRRRRQGRQAQVHRYQAGIKEGHQARIKVRIQACIICQTQKRQDQGSQNA
jgi:hypothetical protein